MCCYRMFILVIYTTTTICVYLFPSFQFAKGNNLSNDIRGTQSSFEVIHQSILSYATKWLFPMICNIHSIFSSSIRIIIFKSLHLLNLQMDPHSGMTGLDMLGSPHSDGMSSGHSMSSSLPISSSVSVDPHTHPSAQLAVNAAAHHSAMYGAAHGAHSAATASMMSPHTSLVHPHHPHHHHTPVVSMQDTDTDPR